MNIKEAFQAMKDEEAKRNKKDKFEQECNDFYNPPSEEELKRKELARHLDCLRRLKERHERGEI